MTNEERRTKLVKNLWKDFRVEVAGFDFDPNIEEERVRINYFEKQIVEYLLLFNSLPIVGLELEAYKNEDSPKLHSILFDGSYKAITFYLEYV